MNSVQGGGMGSRILIVSDNRDFITLCEATGSEFEITCTETAQDGLTALSAPGQYQVVLADVNVSDLVPTRFFKQVAEVSSAVPLLAAEEQDITTALETANRLCIFRLLSMPSSLDLLQTVLQDASCQFKLISREQKLRKKIQRLSVTDALTGCFTRTVLEERLPIELQRSIRYTHYLSVIHCDIDQLAEINKIHGHRIGDRFLTGVAQAAREILRNDVDWITRWGDDDFIIILPETPIRGAGIVAERLRKSMDELTIESDDVSIRTTVSVGVSGYAPETAEWNNTFDSLLLVAANCLEQAKSDGGNKVLICP